MSDLTELSDKQLLAEFDRLATLRDECEASMRDIRAEQSRRKDAKIAALIAKEATT